MLYFRQMSGLTPPRSRSVTIAAVLALVTGCSWMVLTGAMLWAWQDDPEGIYPGHQYKILGLVSVVGCMSVGTVIGSFGIFFRRNWGRILVVMLSGPWMLFGWFFLKPLLSLPASLRHHVRIAPYAFPFAAALASLTLLARKRVRTEFLPPAIVQIYVNLLVEGPRSSRPTQALDLGNGLFELLPATGNDPEVEHWEFRPGSIVRGKEAHRDGETYLLAVSFGP
jgi:hypothetical protein